MQILDQNSILVSIPPQELTEFIQVVKGRDVLGTMGEKRERGVYVILFYFFLFFLHSK